MKVDCVFETSFEVCNKVGGIYTVISSKARLLTEHYAQYFLIGPYFHQTAEFSPQELPIDLHPAIARVQQQGIIVHYGKWLIAGQPDVFLLEFQPIIGRTDEFKKRLWEAYQLDSLGAQFDYTEPLTFSLAAGILIQEILNSDAYAHVRCVSHAHEWICGFTNLYLKLNNCKAGTVFTTHATVLGRAMCGNGMNLYKDLKNINPDQKARELGVYNKFSAERAAAIQADVFTAVSEITANEAAALLGRQPQILVLNGLEMAQFPSIEATGAVHAQTQHKMIDFIRSYFFAYHQFDISQTLTCYISGRFEMANKGFDALISALSRLDAQLREEKSDKTVVCFFLTPLECGNPRQDVTDNRIRYKRLSSAMDAHAHALINGMIDRSISESAAGNLLAQRVMYNPHAEQLFNLRVKPYVTLYCKGKNLPAPLSTHDMKENNELLQALRVAGLHNEAFNRVKVVVYPIYLTGIDGLFDMGYYDATSGCHLGIFPSWYEPWGYTPLEGAAMGVPVITTDASGFGRFIKPLCEGRKNQGVIVLDRVNSQWDNFIARLCASIYTVAMESSQDRSRRAIHARELADFADWSTLVQQYFRAHELAVNK